MRKVVCILLIMILFVNISPVPSYAKNISEVSKFYGIDNSRSVFKRIGKWLNKEISFNFKFGWEITDNGKFAFEDKILPKTVNCRNCKEKVPFQIAVYTHGYCEKCYKDRGGDVKVIKHLIKAEEIMDKKKVERINEVKNAVIVGSAGVAYMIDKQFIKQTEIVY